MKEIKIRWDRWIWRVAQGVSFGILFSIGMLLISRGLLAISEPNSMIVALGIVMVIGGLGAWLSVGISMWNVIARLMNKRNGGQKDEEDYVNFTHSRGNF